MGYTHYWQQHRAFTGEEWRALCDFTRCAISWHDYPVCGGDGNGEPEICSEYIALNGSDAAGEAHETLYIEREGSTWEFCKTARKNYDPIVVAVLIWIHRNTDAFYVTSDAGDRTTTDPRGPQNRALVDMDYEDKHDEYTTAMRIYEAAKLGRERAA
jgi:hypothetical protein